MSWRTITDLGSAARTLAHTASKTLAVRDGYPPSVRVLREYQDDACAVVAAVLRDLAGGPAGAGTVITPRAGEIRLSELADLVEQGGGRATVTLSAGDDARRLGRANRE